MKISFDDKSSVQVVESEKPDHVYIIISAKDFNNPLKKITNSVEISKEDFKRLISDIKI